MSALLLPASARQRVPWKNGGGHTAEVVVMPDDGAAPTAGSSAFDWRLSIATVDRDGGFSSFPGVGRSIMALSPQGLALIDNGNPVTLRQYDVHQFWGENDVAAVDVTGPTLDLNLMIRREAFSGDLRYGEMAGDELVGIAAGHTVVVLLSGELRFEGRLLQPHDAVLMGDGGADVTGYAQVALASISPREPAGDGVSPPSLRNSLNTTRSAPQRGPQLALSAQGDPGNDNKPAHRLVP